MTDGRLAVDVPDSGDTIILKAVSEDNGKTYSGTYSYRCNTYPSGQVSFKRFRNEDGSETFRGQWTAADGRDSWTLEVDPID